MAKVSKSIILGYNKCAELAVKFENILDSFWHKDEKIPLSAIDFAETTVFGNPFTLVKHPTNNDSVKINTLENNDFIVNGFRDNNTFWSKAQCKDVSNKDNENSWTVYGSSDDLILI